MRAHETLQNCISHHDIELCVQHDDGFDHTNRLYACHACGFRLKLDRLGDGQAELPCNLATLCVTGSVIS